MINIKSQVLNILEHFKRDAWPLSILACGYNQKAVKIAINKNKNLSIKPVYNDKFLINTQEKVFLNSNNKLYVSIEAVSFFDDFIGYL